MLYPSVAWQHKHNNLAIVPESVDQKLLLIEATEYEVIETFYNRQFALDTMPATLKMIRKSLCVSGNEIVWNDDK